MTNAKKYLKDGVEAKEIWHNYQEFLMNNDKTENTCTFVEFMEEKVKLQLTEDERVMLRNLDKRYKSIYRTNQGNLCINQGCVGIAFDQYNHLFQFIKNGEEYEIKELLGDEK